MADAEVLNVKIRESRGTAKTRKLRDAGETPAVLYGHGKDTLCLQVPTDEVDAAIRHGSQLVQLRGDVKVQALFKDVQWDPLGVNVLHLDLTRVRAGEIVELTLPIELRGEAPGSKKNGIVNQLIHEAEVECKPAAIPEKLEVNINELDIDQSIHAGEIEMPEGVKLLLDPEAVIVTCFEEQVEEEVEEEAVAGAAEPEVIGRKEEEEEGESGD